MIGIGISTSIISLYLFEIQVNEARKLTERVDIQVTVVRAVRIKFIFLDHQNLFHLLSSTYKHGRTNGYGVVRISWRNSILYIVR